MAPGGRERSTRSNAAREEWRCSLREREHGLVQALSRRLKRQVCGRLRFALALAGAIFNVRAQARVLSQRGREFVPGRSWLGLRGRRRSKAGIVPTRIR